MDILQQINQTVQEIKTDVGELLKWKAQMQEHVLNQDRMIDGVRKTVYGNPDNGIVSKVQRLLNGKKSSTSWKDFWLSILRIVIATAILGVMGFLLFLYAKFGKGT